MQNHQSAAAPHAHCKGRQRNVRAPSEVADLAAIPTEVLANVLAKLPPCEAVRLQRVSQSFWRAAVAGEELEAGVVDRLLNVLSAVGPRGRASLAACAARRWLARNAASTKRLCSRTFVDASAYISLVSCLPALEAVELSPRKPLLPGDLGGLLEALAWCPRLKRLDLCVVGDDRGEGAEAIWPSRDTAVFAKLRGLTKLALILRKGNPSTLPDVVDALVSLTGLAELSLCSSSRSTVVPAALGQLRGLRALDFRGLCRCELEAGCLDLPNLLSLGFQLCSFGRTEVLPGVAALQSLTRIEFVMCSGPRFFDHQLAELPRLQHMVFETHGPPNGGACLWLSRLPADMGALSSALLHLDFSVHELTHFPLALTQLVALEHLNASGNEFAALPAGITALSRLTYLQLGRKVPDHLSRPAAAGGHAAEAYLWEDSDPLHLHMCTLDVRALGDLSGFPALRWLQFADCEVVLCESMDDAVWHPNLVSLCFWMAYPAPECALVVLQLCQALQQVGRGAVLHLIGGDRMEDVVFPARPLVKSAQKLTPFDKFAVALQACGM